MTLKRLSQEIRACRICVDTPYKTALPHAPRPIFQASASARLAIFGQAPGLRAHDAGEPFRDPSGTRLREWMGVSETEFYDAERIAIVPMGFCFPGYDANGSDLPPRKECADHWREKLLAMLCNIELALLIGQYAQSWHLEEATGRNMTETVADWRRHMARKQSPKYLPLPHPSWRNNAWLKKNPWFETDVLPRLRREVRRLLKPKKSKN